MRTFPVGDYRVHINLAPITNEAGSPIWDVSWFPARPDRMSSALIRAFDEGRRKAMLEITQAREAAGQQARRDGASQARKRAFPGILSTSGAST